MINVLDNRMLTIHLALVNPKTFTKSKVYFKTVFHPFAALNRSNLMHGNGAQSIPAVGLLKFELLGNERFALNQCVHECRDGMIFFLRGRGNFIRQILIGKSKGTAQSVSNQMFGKPTGKIIFFLGD